MDPLADFYMHTAIVKTTTGTNGLGETMSEDSAPFPCFINDQMKLVRNAQGQQIIGATTVICNNRYAALFQPDSEVFQVLSDGGQVPKGRITLINTSDSGKLQLPDHTTVTLV